MSAPTSNPSSMSAEHKAEMLEREISIRRGIEVSKHYADWFLRHMALHEYHRQLAANASMVVTPTANGHTQDERAKHMQFSQNCFKVAMEAAGEFLRAADGVRAMMSEPEPVADKPPGPPKPGLVLAQSAGKT